MAPRKDNFLKKFDVDFTPLREFMWEMDRFFHDSFKQMHTNFQLRPFWVDVRETGDDFIIEAELPGYSREQIEIEIFGNQLHIRAEDKQFLEGKDENHGVYSKEQSYRRKERTISLPIEIPEKETTASMKNGILTITVPKNNSKRKFLDIGE